VTADEEKPISLLFLELRKPGEEPLLWHGICLTIREREEGGFV